MARVIVLDSGPLGLACDKRGKREVEDISTWLILADLSGAVLVIPAIADYEVRRELIRSGAKQGVKRLDDLCQKHRFLPISSEAMRRAAG